MNKIWLLIKAQLINFSRVNELRGGGKGKQGRFVMTALGVGIFILFVSTYNIITAKSLVQVGQQELIPAYMVSLSSFSTLFLTLFYSNNILFGSRDLDTLFSLPVKHSYIISSKLMFIYLLNIVIVSLFMLPGGLIWVTSGDLPLVLIFLYFVSLFLVPLIPMCLSAFTGLIIVLASSLFKNRNIFALVFSLIAMGIIGYLSLSAMKSGREGSSIGIVLVSQISGLYPLAKLFMPSDFLPTELGIGIFMIISLVIFVAFIKIVSLRYNWLNKLARTSSRYNAGKKTYRRSTVFWALYKKESSQFLSSYMPVLNAGLGVILLSVFSLFLLFVSVDDIGSYLGMENMGDYLKDFAPFVIVSLLIISCPAASSISLEGKNIWILQSSPVQAKMVLNAKIAVNLTLHLIGYVLSILAFSVKLEMGFLQSLMVIVVPICYSLFMTVVGISLNKQFPNYDWDSEMVVIKQSAPVLVSALIGMLVLAIPFLLITVLSFPAIPTMLLVIITLLAVTSLVYKKTALCQL